MADHYLEDIKLYGPPNPALSEILKSARLRTIVAEKTAQVAAVYVNRITPRSKSGRLRDGVQADVLIGGFSKDRWVGEVRSTAEYAATDEFGRKNPAPGQRGSVYEGSHDLRDSLYSVLKHRI